MKFTPTKIEGVWLIEMERHLDERGWFARTWCAEELKANGLEFCVAQCSCSLNSKRGTLRGMHYQADPHEEVKLVRCTRGAAFDVALDLRPHSPTFCQWTACEISAENGIALYIPRGCAHGFQTLEDDTEVYYMIDTPYVPSGGGGLRWNDPAFDIKWPFPELAIINKRDSGYPDFVAPACA